MNRFEVDARRFGVRHEYTTRLGNIDGAGATATWRGETMRPSRVNVPWARQRECRRLLP